MIISASDIQFSNIKGLSHSWRVFVPPLSCPQPLSRLTVWTVEGKLASVARGLTEAGRLAFSATRVTSRSCVFTPSPFTMGLTTPYLPFRFMK